MKTIELTDAEYRTLSSLIDFKIEELENFDDCPSLIECLKGIQQKMDMTGVNYSVFYKEGDEANDVMLTYDEAMNLARVLEADGQDVIVAKLNEEDEWTNVYETETESEMPWDYGKHFD